DPNRSICTGVINIFGFYQFGEQVPVPDRKSGVASFNGAVKIIPVIKQSFLDLRGINNVDLGDIFMLLHFIQEPECAIENPNGAVSGYNCNILPLMGNYFDNESFVIYLVKFLCKGIGNFFWKIGFGPEE